MFGPGPDPQFAQSLLDRVGLRDRVNYRPRQLSVGQQQRVALARAVANRPRLVLADEPTGNLDPHHAAESLRTMRELCSETGAALLLVSHDAGALAQFDDVIEFAGINRAGAGVAP
jgi:putative ABC transport system ATP-binding protein